MKRLPDILLNITGKHVTIDPNASIVEASGKRYATPYECSVRGESYTCTVVVKCEEPYVLFRLPKMLEDGTFLIRGKRVVMLRRQRAKVPIMLSKGIMAIEVES